MKEKYINQEQHRLKEKLIKVNKLQQKLFYMFSQYGIDCILLCKFMCSLAQNCEDIKRFYKMSSSQFFVMGFILLDLNLSICKNK